MVNSDMEIQVLLSFLMPPKLLLYMLLFLQNKYKYSRLQDRSCIITQREDSTIPTAHLSCCSYASSCSCPVFYRSMEELGSLQNEFRLQQRQQAESVSDELTAHCLANKKKMPFYYYTIYTFRKQFPDSLSGVVEGTICISSYQSRDLLVFQVFS